MKVMTGIAIHTIAHYIRMKYFLNGLFLAIQVAETRSFLTGALSVACCY